MTQRGVQIRRRRRPRRRKLEIESEMPGHSSLKAADSRRERLSAFYAAGPVVEIGGKDRQKNAGQHAKKSGNEKRPESERIEESVPSTYGRGSSKQDSADASSNVLRLRGRTEADFKGGSYETKNTKVRRAKGCKACESGDCIRVTGTLVARYRVTTRVILPRVSDYPKLKRCQKTRVRNAIKNVLAPHEWKHVRAFRQYNGVTRRRFDLTLCRAEYDARIRSMFEAEAQSREKAARAASDVLDPFYFDVDLDCEE